MTGENHADCRNFQPEFWPSEWKYEQQKLFGAIDAPEYSPAGAMEWYEGKYISFPVSLVSARAW